MGAHSSNVSWIFIILCLGTLLTTVTWYWFDDVEFYKPPRPKRGLGNLSDVCKGCSDVEFYKPPRPKRGLGNLSDVSKGCREVINKVKERYSQTWKKQEENSLKFRSRLIQQCNGFNKAIITQENTPIGSKIVYDGDGKKLQVTKGIFSTFAKEHPFKTKRLKTCALVGNGGILTDSRCGKSIDSAQFIMRCNLPPLKNGYEEHVGIKTDLVTANPTIFLKKYGSLKNNRRRPFVKSLQIYGNALLLLPAFSFSFCTPVSLRAVHAVEDSNSPAQPIFFNPGYLRNLSIFWRSEGLKPRRLSTGFIMTSLALEICDNVELYGFWPFGNHPYNYYPLSNHYYDNTKVSAMHAMPAEFNILLKLHSEGVLKLHLGNC